MIFRFVISRIRLNRGMILSQERCLDDEDGAVCDSVNRFQHNAIGLFSLICK